MANTIKDSPNGACIELSAIDSDFTLTDLLTAGKAGGGFKVHSIQFTPAAAGDACTIIDARGDSPVMFYAKCVDDTDQRIKYYPADMEYLPFLDFSAGTYTAGSTVQIILRRQ